MINLNSVAAFYFNVQQDAILEIDGNYYIWSDPEFNGDHTIRSLNCSFEEYFKDDPACDAGKWRIIDYCGPDVKILV